MITSSILSHVMNWEKGSLVWMRSLHWTDVLNRCDENIGMITSSILSHVMNWEKGSLVWISMFLQMYTWAQNLKNLFCWPTESQENQLKLMWTKCCEKTIGIFYQDITLILPCMDWKWITIQIWLCIECTFPVMTSYYSINVLLLMISLNARVLQ